MYSLSTILHYAAHLQTHDLRLIGMQTDTYYYSQHSGQSVSKLVEKFFAAITVSKVTESQDLSPKVRSLFGVLPTHQNLEQEYHDYLEAKYV